MTVANERVVNGIKTRVLHNKDYVEVSERVRIVHSLDKPFGVLESGPFEIASRLLWRVVISFDNQQYIGNAEVKLDAPKNSPDGTNPFECAETSAYGRALAFAGLGTVESISSYDEIARSQPFVAVIEQAGKGVVESVAPKRLNPPQEQVSEGLKQLIAQAKARAKAVGVASNIKEWYAFVAEVLGSEVQELSLADVGKINGKLTQLEKLQAA